MAHERKCMVCGKAYQYCAHGCKDYNPKETWRYIFCGTNCMAVYELWQAYRGKEMSKEQIVEALRKINLDSVIGSGTMVAKDIEEILGIKSEPEVEVEAVEEEAQAKEEVEPVEKKADADKPPVVKADKYEKHYNGKRSDYKKK